MCSRKDSVTWVTQLPVFPEPSVQGWYSSPLKVHILILRSCDYVTLCNKRGFEDVIKLSILRWSDYSRLPGGALCNHKGLYKRDVGGLYSKNVIYLEKQVAVWEFWRYSTAGFEDGGREYIGQGVQVASWIPVSSASLMLELSPLTLCWPLMLMCVFLFCFFLCFFFSLFLLLCCHIGFARMTAEEEIFKLAFEYRIIFFS